MGAQWKNRKVPGALCDEIVRYDGRCGEEEHGDEMRWDTPLTTDIPRVFEETLQNSRENCFLGNNTWPYCQISLGQDLVYLRSWRTFIQTCPDRVILDHCHVDFALVPLVHQTPYLYVLLKVTWTEPVSLRSKRDLNLHLCWPAFT